MDTVETGSKNRSLRDRSHACLGKIKFRTFPKRVGLRILSLESVDFFGAREHYLSCRKQTESSLAKLRWSGVVIFQCMQMSVVMSMRFIFGDD